MRREFIVTGNTAACIITHRRLQAKPLANTNDVRDARGAVGTQGKEHVVAGNNKVVSRYRQLVESVDQSCSQRDATLICVDSVCGGGHSHQDKRHSTDCQDRDGRTLHGRQRC